MTYQELRDCLRETSLFTEAEVLNITRHCGQATIGNAVIACELIGIELCGNDVEIMTTVK